MSNHHAGHAAKEAGKIIRNLDPLGEYKNPFVAFLMGLVFGALGVAIYFKSGKDFLICMGMFIAACIILPGFGAILGWVFAPCYGAYRAVTSNEALGM